MPNKEHLRILEKGIKEWNVWRKENPDIEPDLSLADLSHQFLIEVKFIGSNHKQAKLLGVNFNGTNLTGTRLNYSHLSATHLSKASLKIANLSNTKLIATTMSRARLRGARLVEANFMGADLQVADLRGANLRGAKLNNAYLNGADLSEAIGLSFSQLSTTENLHQIKGLEPKLEKELKEQRPELFEKPQWW